MLIQLITQD